MVAVEDIYANTRPMAETMPREGPLFPEERADGSPAALAASAGDTELVPTRTIYTGAEKYEALAQDFAAPTCTTQALT